MFQKFFALKSLLLLACMTGFSNISSAEAPQFTHGLAMVGAPKYSNQMKHLDYVNPNAPKGGTLRQGVTGTFDSVNPYIVKGRKAAGLHYVSDSLLGRVWDEPFSLYGLIAEKVRLAEDRSWIEFQVNPKAQFQDGSSIRLEDVVFSYETLKEQGRPTHRSYYKKVESIDLSTEQNLIRFNFKADPSGHYDQELPLLISLMPILSQKFWQQDQFDQTRLTPFIGSGPYQISNIDPGRQITLTRWENYWAKDLPINKGLYNFDRLIFDYYRDDTVALEAFKTGNFDFRREFNATKWATQYQFPAAEDGRVTVTTLPHSRPEPAKGLIFNTRKNLFADIKTRQALLYAFDFEWLNKSLWNKSFKRVSSTFPNSTLAASPHASEAEKEIFTSAPLPPHPDLYQTALTLPKTNGSGLRSLRRNLKKANQLLEQAGWHIQEGRRVHENGQKFEFEILLSDPQDEKIALSYREALEKLGITTRIRTVDSSQFQQRLNQFDYDMVLYRWISSLSPGNEQMTYWGSTAAAIQGTRNYAGVQDPLVDYLISQLIQSKSQQELTNYAHALDRTLMKGAYFIPLAYSGFDRVAYWSFLDHPKVTPLYGLVLESWWSKKHK